MTGTAAAAPRVRRSAKETREIILEAALDEFAGHGFGGARIERIVERAQSNIRLVYLHFGNKEGLYAAVVEKVYVDIRLKEQELDLDAQKPVEAMKRFVDFTMRHFVENPAFLKLTTYENMLGGETVRASAAIAQMSSPLIATIRSVLARGQADGSFRRKVDALQLYVSIVALACHHINNVHTLSATFRTDLNDPKWLAARQRHVREMILTFLAEGAA